jgi:hypothetical protein
VLVTTSAGRWGQRLPVLKIPTDAALSVCDRLLTTEKPPTVGISRWARSVRKLVFTFLELGKGLGDLGDPAGADVAMVGGSMGLADRK